MSMINEFISKLREKAAIFENSDLALMGIAKDYKESADMIEVLSEKLADANIKRSEQYYRGVEERKRRLLFLIDHYGTKPQQDIAIEEMSELQKAIVKHRRYETEETKKAVIEEIADVQVMLEQLKIMFSCRSKIDEIMEAKIDRQIDRVRRCND